MSSRPPTDATPTDTSGVSPTMRAVRLHGPGGPGDLRFERIATPRLRAEEVLVRVHAASITRDELDWPENRLPAIPSYELSGVVAAVGPDVDGVSAGEAVFALTRFDRDGAAADYVAVLANVLAPKPRSIDHVQSAALLLAALSAWQGLFVHGRLEKGQRVLIHGATGGVGHLASQLARGRGAHVIGTTSSANAELARELGVHEVLDSKTSLEGALDPVDLVFDTVGGERLARSPAILREGGRLVSVAEEPSTSSGRGIATTYFVVEPDGEQLIELARLVERRELRPAVDSVFSLEESRAAFERSMAPGKRGKVVLKVLNDQP